MSNFLLDIKYAVRLLVKSPLFMFAAIVTLALGIGANTAIFSAVDAVLLRPLPFYQQQRIIKIWENNLQKGRERNPVSPPNFIDWRDQNNAFESVAAYSSFSPNVTGIEGAERLQGVQVTGDLFPLLGVNPLLGQYFSSENGKANDEKVVVISHALWKRRFGGDNSILNSTITLNGSPYTIIGVMPPDFQFPIGAERKDIWVPLVFDTSDLKGRATRYLQVLGRLKPGVSIDQARTDMQRIASQIEQSFPQSNSGWGVTLLPLYEQLVADSKWNLLILLCAVGLVLLIGCANVANLLLARASARQKEVSVRLAIGASRGRIVRQLLTESCLLSLIGGGLGAALAYFGITTIIASAPDSIPRLKDITIDARVLGFTIGVSLLTAFVFGLFPALQASKPDVNGMLKEGSRSLAGGTRGHRMRRSLVVVEVALALMLLVLTGLVVKSFSKLIGVDSGFNPKGVLTAQITLPSYKYEKPEQQMTFFKQLVEHLQTLPGVQSAAIISYLPLSGSNFEWVLSIEGRPPADPTEKLFAEYRQISSDYFRTMGIPVLRGRDFNEHDAAGAPAVIIVDETFARQYFPNEDPLGKRIGFGRNPEWREIVGIVSDVRHFGLEAQPKPEAYVPHLQDPWPAMAVVVRSNSETATLSAAVRGEVRAIDKDQPVYNVRTMESLLADSVARRRLVMVLLGVFSAVALALSAIGVFGVMANSVSQRTHEIGVRIALGATPRSILKMIVLQAALLAFLGIVIGVIGALLTFFIFTHYISSLLYEVSSTDPLVFMVVALLLSLVLMIASYIPARRATAVDPMSALRYE